MRRARTLTFIASASLVTACGGGATVGAPNNEPVPVTSLAPGPPASAAPAPGASASASPAPSPMSTATTSTGLSFAACGPNDPALDSDKPPCASTSKTTVGTGCTPSFVVTAGGYSSCNIKWISHFNLPPTSIGGHYVPELNTFFVTGYVSGLYAFDVTDPGNVKQRGNLLLSLGDPTGLPISDIQNEDTLATPKIVVVSDDYLPTGEAVVIDVHDPANMKVLATVPGGDGHTNNCISNAAGACQYDFTTEPNTGHTGDNAIDLTDPAHPVLLPKWDTVFNGTLPGQIHDLTEIHPGLVATASDPVTFLDTTNPLSPKVLFHLHQSPAETSQSQVPPAQNGHIGHSVKWPRLGQDQFFLGQSEGIYDGRCELFRDDGRTLYSYDTTGWQTKHDFNLVGSYTLEMGDGDEGLAGGVTEVDSNGNPSTVSVGFLGCSSHWFEPNPNFDNGGLVALSAFSFGVRLLDVSSQGRIRQIGYFVPVGGAHGADTVAVYWIGGRYMATIDFSNGGLDIIEYTGPLPASGPLPLDRAAKRTR